MNIKDPMIIPMIFIFLSCCEKANDNKKFSHETLLWITNSNPLSRTMEAGLPKKGDLDSLQIWQGVWQERRVVFLRGVDNLMHTTFTFSLLTSILSSQLAFSKSVINKFWSKFFQFLLNIFDLDLGEFAKKISNIANWGRWSEAVDAKLICLSWKLHYRKCYQSKLKKNRKFLLVATRAGIENWMKVCQQNYWQV